MGKSIESKWDTFNQSNPHNRPPTPMVKQVTTEVLHPEPNRWSIEVHVVTEGNFLSDPGRKGT